MSSDDVGRDGPVAGLDELYPTAAPAGLEEEVVRALRAESLLDPRRSGFGSPWALRIAAGLILFAFGWTAGRSGGEDPRDDAAAYMLLLWEGADFGRGAAPGSFSQEYADWARSVGTGGVGISGDELGTDRIVLGAPTPIGPPVAAGAPTIGGYFVVHTDDEAFARSLAETHPHLRHGGWIEVAPLVR